MANLTDKERKNLLRKYKTQVDFYAWVQWLVTIQLTGSKKLVLGKRSIVGNLWRLGCKQFERKGGCLVRSNTLLCERFNYARRILWVR